MFGSSNNTPFSMPVVPANYGGNGGFGGSWGDDWIALIIFAMLFGYGGYGFNGGFGGFGGGFMPWLFGGAGSAGGAMENYVLGSDFSMLSRQVSDGFNSQERKLDSISNGLCDGFYTEAQLINGVNQNIAQNGYNTLTAITTNGYENRLATQTLSSQLADCCCTTQQNLKDINYNIATQAAGVNASIKDCCCENEKIAMQNRFDLAQYNCNTLQAIDKVGDRIIDYLAADKAQTLRDENQSLRLAASQAAQNSYLIGQLRPAPIPAYQVANPYCNCGYTAYGCGCN